jgi:hypothetical protein
MKNGLYFLYPEGSGWIVADIRDSQVKGRAYESDVDTHDAARDNWAGIIPSEADTIVQGEKSVATVPSSDGGRCAC